MMCKNKIVRSTFFVGLCVVFCLAHANTNPTIKPQTKQIPRLIFNAENKEMFEAANLMAQGEFLEASTIYENLYKSTNDNYFLKQIAMAQSQAGNITRASEFATKYQELSKDLDDPNMNLIIAEDYIDKRDYNSAIILLEKCLRTQQNIQVHYILSNLYIQQRMPQKALQHLITIYNDEMTNGTKLKLEALNNIITIFLQQQNITQALQYLNEYVSNNDYVLKLETFFPLYAKMNSVNVLKENLYKRFNNLENLDNAQMLISVLVELKNYDEALQFIQKNANLLGQNAQEMSMQIYAMTKKFDKAMGIAKSLYAQTKDIEFLGLETLYEYETIQNKNKITLQPLIEKLEFVVNERAKKLQKQNKKPSNDEAFFYNFLGYTLIDYEINVKKGINYVKTALEIQPKSAEYLDSLAWGYYKIGDCQKAQATFQLIPATEINQLQELKDHENLIRQCKIK